VFFAKTNVGRLFSESIEVELVIDFLLAQDD
jgi:hypothetical protein